MPQEVPWLLEARKLDGLKEIPGPQHNPEILALADDSGLGWINDDETAWCATFVGGTLKRAKCKPSGSAAARSYLHWGIDVLDKDLRRIPLGAIVVFSRPPDEWKGHVGYAVGRTERGDIVTLSGNQKNMVRVDPIAGWRLIGARWPIEYRDDLRMLTPLPLISTNDALSANEA